MADVASRPVSLNFSIPWPSTIAPEHPIVQHRGLATTRGATNGAKSASPDKTKRKGPAMVWSKPTRRADDHDISFLPTSGDYCTLKRGRLWRAVFGALLLGAASPSAFGEVVKPLFQHELP